MVDQSARSESATYAFRARLELLDYGRMAYWVVRLPKALQAEAPFSERRKLRMVGTIGGQKVSLAWLIDRGHHYVIVSRALARAARVGLGEAVDVRFTLVSDTKVDVPRELREALQQEPAWRKPWAALTPGKQRGLCHLVDKLKDPEKRALRAVSVLREVAEGRPPGPPRRRA